jgi:hypothetical protein
MPEKKALVNWEEKLAAQATETAAEERPSIANISLRGGQMTYEGQPIPNNTLQCIPIHYAFENRFYAEKWDPNNIQPPSCYALAVSEANLAPHENVTEAKNETCLGCPMAEWGSSLSGGRGKACSEIRRVLVMPALKELTPETIAKAEIAMIRVPVTSVRSWSNFVNTCAASAKRPPWAMFATITVVPDARTQFKMSFEAAAKVDVELLAALEARREQLEKVLLAPYGAVSDKQEPTKDSGKY